MNTYTEPCSRSHATRSAGVLETLSRTLRCWFAYQQLKRQVANERQQLLSLSETELKDLGINRHEAELEAARRDIPLDRLA